LQEALPSFLLFNNKKNLELFGSKLTAPPKTAAQRDMATTTTIEERVFQRNVPGRFSSWADQDDESVETGWSVVVSEASAAAAADDERIEAAATAAATAAAAAVADDRLDSEEQQEEQEEQQHKTGPKGVLADYRAHQRAAHARAQRAKVSQSVSLDF
jgi:hypothetical protein